jgi:hypothetical protein
MFLSILPSAALYSYQWIVCVKSIHTCIQHSIPLKGVKKWHKWLIKPSIDISPQWVEIWRVFSSGQPRTVEMLKGCQILVL